MMRTSNWCHSEDMWQTRFRKISQGVGEETYIHHINPVGAAESATLPGSKRDIRPPCCINCTNCNRTEGHKLLIRSKLHLATSQIPIHVLIDTGCMQTNVVSARIAAAIREESGEIRKASVTLASGADYMVWKE